MNFHLQWYASLPSTNTFLKERLAAERDLPSGTVIAAREQTQGRGRRDREWLSLSGENLTFSIFLRGRHDPRRVSSVSMAAAIAAAELLENMDLKPTLKWPNDVLVGGKKICGILSERIAGGVIVGIGLNINMQNAGHIDQPATSVLIETGKRHEVDELLRKLLDSLSVRLAEWEQGGFQSIREQWESRVSNVGGLVEVHDSGRVRVGLLAGFGADGELLLRDASDNIFAVWAGDLLF